MYWLYGDYKPPQPRKRYSQYGAIIFFDGKEVFIPKGSLLMTYMVNEKGEYDGERYKKN